MKILEAKVLNLEYSRKKENRKERICMSNYGYQYGTSARKLKPEYEPPKNKTSQKVTKAKTVSNSKRIFSTCLRI